MNKKKLILAVALTVAILIVGASATMAYLMTSSQPVINTFTVGQVQITLEETTGPNYALIPGTQVDKDPTLTVLAGSDACWLFFRLEEAYDLSRYVSYKLTDGWTPLDGVEGVSYRQVPETAIDLPFPLLDGNKVQVLDTVTEEDLAEIQNAPYLNFTGYAVQNAEVATAQDAWRLLLTQAEGVSER